MPRYDQETSTVGKGGMPSSIWGPEEDAKLDDLVRSLTSLTAGFADDGGDAFPKPSAPGGDADDRTPECVATEGDADDGGFSYVSYTKALANLKGGAGGAAGKNHDGFGDLPSQLDGERESEANRILAGIC